MLYRLVAVLTFAVGFALAPFSLKEETSIPVKEEISKQILFVKLPPKIDKNSSNEEIFQYLSDYAVLPIPLSEIKERKISFPNACIYLEVSLKNDGKIMLNFEQQEDLEKLEQRLKTIFQEREEKGVYDVNSFQVVKKVMIKAPNSAEYKNVIKLIETVKNSGADPIIWMVDEPYPTELNCASRWLIRAKA